jgi:trk system potassium uptake protein
MNVRKVIGYVGLVVLSLGLFMATSLPWILAEEDRSITLPWLLAVGVTVATGGLAALLGRERRKRAGRGIDDREISRREAMVIVAVSWFVCSAFSGLPFWLEGTVDGPVDALFEATSGFTTTGSTVLGDIEASSAPALWWRSLIQWLGGMGIIVLFVAIFPQVGGGGRRLFQSETPGPEKEQLRPRIRETGLALWRIYAALTAVLFALLWIEGMGPFDAACHAFTCLATGGFSTKNASIAGFDSALIDVTITLFMLLAGVNFGLYYALRRRFEWKVLKDPELIVYGAIFAAVTLAVSLTIVDRHGGLLEAFRHGAFQTAALLTSTGYGTDDFDLYPSFSRNLLIFLMFVGGMGGSTAGGFKVSRVMIAVSAAFGEVRRAVHPRAVVAVRLGRRAVADPVVRATLALFVISVLLIAGSTLALDAMGLGFESAFSATMTCIWNSGPGLNELGPTSNFATIPDAGKLMLAALMITGRLEFYTVLALLLPGFWRRGGAV